ncbi:MAG: hypothetical protein AB7I13_19640 [Vicinamibacterales bacterium]
MCRRVRIALPLALLGIGASFPAEVLAQQPVSEVLEFLITNQSIRTGSFDRDRAAAQATSDTISRALLASLSTLPVSSSSGAFVYRWNVELGTAERSTASFGPVLTERTVTAGRGRGSLGLSFQHLRFTSLGGRALRDGTLVTTANRFTDEAEPFDVDQLSLAIDADIVTLHGNLGVTDNLEVAVAVPVVGLRMEGSRQNVYRGRAFTEASASVQVVGLADIVTRAKYSVVTEDGFGLGATVEGRVPSGKRADLLGAGSYSGRFLLVGSAERGRTTLHANAGVSVGGFARDVSAAAAASVVLHDRLTVVGELVGRRLNRPGRVTLTSAPHPVLSGVETLRLSADGGSSTLLTFAPGLKWNAGSTWVVLASASIPLRRDGLTAPFAPFIGLDWSPAQ